MRLPASGLLLLAAVHRQIQHKGGNCKSVAATAGDALQGLSSRAHDVGSSVMSVPAGIFATISGNARDVPRLLVSDVLAVYHTASDALADLNARGETLFHAYIS